MKWRVRIGLCVASVLAAFALGGAAAAAGSARKVVFVDLSGQVKVAPQKIFLTAGPGPYLIDLTWHGWGSNQATATGTYVSDCPSCYPPKRRPARLTVRGLARCKPAWRADAYRDGSLTTIPDGSLSRRTRRTVPLDTGYEFCHKYAPPR